MDDEYITPGEAAKRLMALHYPGSKRGNTRRVRAALIGALQSGQLDWRCREWEEKFVAESGATYDENGGKIQCKPKYGWPRDFWQRELAVDDVFWRDNVFISYGTVTMHTASKEVKLWLARNDDLWANWTRSANDVLLCWKHAQELLTGPGWQIWIVEAQRQTKSKPILAPHYRKVLIDMIGLAVREPNAEWTKRTIFERLRKAFDNEDLTPDDADLKRLTTQIFCAVTSGPDYNGPAP